MLAMSTIFLLCRVLQQIGRCVYYSMVNAWMAKVPPLVVWDGSHGEDEREIVDSLGLLVVAYEVRLWSEDFHQCQHLATNLVHAGQVLVLRDLGDDSEADTHRCACGFLQCRPHPSFCACIRTSAVNFCLGADDNETTYITMAFIVSFCSLLLHLVAQPYVSVPQLCVLLFVPTTSAHFRSTLLLSLLLLSLLLLSLLLLLAGQPYVNARLLPLSVCQSCKGFLPPIPGECRNGTQCSRLYTDLLAQL